MTDRQKGARMYDLVLEGGLYFDGTGAPGVVRNVGIAGGVIAEVSAAPLEGERVIDATGRWVMPGFVDCHTHYDAELIASPALGESLRHGVTTVTVGSCSISTILSDAEDCSDLFTRVESVPREHVLPLLERDKTWSTPREYAEFLDRHPLGPNVTCFLGHSDLRTRVLGLERAVDPKAKLTEAELAEMERWLHEALDVGMLGLSTMTNPWDKLDGERHRSAALPSTYARWSEYRRLHAILRERGRILQSAPNITTKVNAVLFLLESAGWFGLRDTLKTTLITLADAKSSRGLHRLLGGLTGVVNRVFGGDLRWQTLPMPFEVYADGVDLVVFEEFEAGEALLHLAEQVDRNALMQQPAYRRRFRKDYEKRFGPRVWQRDFHDAFIVECPEAALEGLSFGAVADQRGVHPVDAFLDLVVEHGTSLRWRTTIANDRQKELERMLAMPATLVGFADSGAHIRNMAFYSFPLAFLRLARDAAARGEAFLPIEKAVWRVTGELAEWMGIDAGRIRVGDRADVCVLDPSGLDARLERYHEATMEGFGDLQRMVNRSDGAVAQVLVNGRVAFDAGEFAPEVGSETGFGRFLPAGQRVAGGAARSKASPVERAA